MTDDPMLAKAAVLEKELLNEVRIQDEYPTGFEVVERRLLERAALLIQQMRVRLQGENSTEVRAHE